MAAVDLTPASARPYVGGSTDNTVRNLLFDYNGIGRVDGQGQGGPGGGGGPGPRRGFTGRPFGGVAGGPGGVAGPGGVFGGQPGTLRLFSDAVGGQIAWLLPVAAAGLAAGLWVYRRDPSRLGAVVLFGVWLLLCALVFSYARGIFHSYYTSEMAPAVAALVGVGGVALARASRRRPEWLGAAAASLVATVALQRVLTGRTPGFYDWVRPVALLLGAVALAVLAVAYVAAPARRQAARVMAAGLGIGLAAAMAAPAAWAASEASNPTTNATLPQAGPRGGASANTFGSAAFDGDASLAAFLAGQRRGETWDLVTTSAMTASSLIAYHDLSVLALGGFLGSDPAPAPPTWPGWSRRARSATSS